MCSLWPFHLFVMYGIVLGPLWMVSCTVISQVGTKAEFWAVTFNSTEPLKMSINDMVTVNFKTDDLTDQEIKDGIVTVVSGSDAIPRVNLVEKMYVLSMEPIQGHTWLSSFNVSGNFLGYAKVQLQLHNRSDNRLVKESNGLNIIVVREERVIDRIFTSSVIILASIIYINFGCALDWDVLKKTIIRPIGPIIGFISQFLFMPVISYVIGKALFYDSVPMQLGMFFTGVSPAGGASNIWACVLGANLNLSITMTTISTFAAFGMIPIWIFSLGYLIFAEGKLKVPYDRIFYIAMGLVIPLGIGLLLQRYLPRVSKFMVRILKPCSSLLILFIIIFAIITNLYLFQMFSWKILLAGLALPWLGFLFGMLLSRACKQSPNDVLAIAIETGVQNTGISILLLRLSLGQPEADLTTVVPVAVAIMTPIPLAVLLIYKKCRSRWGSKHEIRLGDDYEESGVVIPNSGEPLSLIKNGDGVRKY